MATLLRLWCAVLILMGGWGSLAAATAPDADTIKQQQSGGPFAVAPDAGDHALIAVPSARDLLHLHGVTPGVGLALLLVAIVPLFFGWRFLRLALALLLGCFLAMWVWQYGMPWLHQLWPASTARSLEPALAVGTGLAFLLGLVLGSFLYQVEMGLTAALLGAMALSLPGMYLGSPGITWILAVVGLIIGFIAGFAIAPYWAALQTSILGGVLVTQGVAVLSQQLVSPANTRLLAYGIGIVAGILGLVVQLSALLHQRQRRPTTGGTGRTVSGRPARV